MVGLHVIAHWQMTRFLHRSAFAYDPFLCHSAFAFDPVLQCLAIMELLLAGQSSLRLSNRVSAPDKGLDLGPVCTPMVIPTFSPARLLIRPKSRRRMIFKTVPPNFLIFFVLDVHIHFALFLIYYQMPIVSQVPLKY